jgi:hypothetical protein
MNGVPGDSTAPELHCLIEVRIGVPLERLQQVQQFYIELLGLLPWPESRQVPGGLGLGDPDCGLFLQFRHDPPVDPVRRRFTLLVSALDELATRLAEHNWPFERFHGLGFTERWILVADPVGHLIELRQSQNWL